MQYYGTGPYKSIILEITPREKKKVSSPARDELKNFFSRFGPIITTYFLDNTEARRTVGTYQSPDRFYILFENENSVKDISTEWAQEGACNFWKLSWNIRFRMKSFPKEVLDHIKSVVTRGSGSQSNDQRAGKGERKTPGPTNLKRNRTSQAEGDDHSFLEANKRPKLKADRGEASDDEPSILDKDIDQLRFAIVLLQNQHERTQSERDIAWSECERYRAERDDARTKCEGYQEERDRAIEKSEADAEACQQLRRQVGELKKELEHKNDSLRSVMTIVRASLEAGLEPGQLGPGPESPRLLYS